jgi:hypothetical protein
MLEEEWFCVFILVSQYEDGDTPSLPISPWGFFDGNIGKQGGFLIGAERQLRPYQIRSWQSGF